MKQRIKYTDQTISLPPGVDFRAPEQCDPCGQSLVDRIEKKINQSTVGTSLADCFVFEYLKSNSDTKHYAVSYSEMKPLKYEDYGSALIGALAKAWPWA